MPAIINVAACKAGICWCGSPFNADAGSLTKPLSLSLSCQRSLTWLLASQAFVGKVVPLMLMLAL